MNNHKSIEGFTLDQYQICCKQKKRMTKQVIDDLKYDFHHNLHKDMFLIRGHYHEHPPHTSHVFGVSDLACHKQGCRAIYKRWLDGFRSTNRRILLLPKSEISSQSSHLLWMYTAQFMSYLVGNPEDWFSGDRAHI